MPRPEKLGLPLNDYKAVLYRRQQSRYELPELRKHLQTEYRSSDWLCHSTKRYFINTRFHTWFYGRAVKG